MPLFPRRDIVVAGVCCSFAKEPSWPGIQNPCCRWSLYLQQTLNMEEYVRRNASNRWHYIVTMTRCIKVRLTVPSSWLARHSQTYVKAQRNAKSQALLDFLSAFISISVPILIYLRLVFQVGWDAGIHGDICVQKRWTLFIVWTRQ